MSAVAPRDPQPSVAAADDPAVEVEGPAAAIGACAPDDARPMVAQLHIGDGEHVEITRAQIVEGMRRLRELHEQDVRPDEGLRERKKRITRQLISDTATWMFCVKGFDRVTVAKVAEKVGVSEKTVFNYFPTKESLVLDREEDLVAGITEALSERRSGESPTRAILALIERECRNIDALGPEYLPMFLAFLRMIDETPSLQNARAQLSARLVAVARDALAASVGADPRDPEPEVAAQALIALWDVQTSSRERHIRAGVPVGELRERVLEDTRRAARLLDGGLGAFYDRSSDDVPNVGDPVV